MAARGGGAGRSPPVLTRPCRGAGPRQCRYEQCTKYEWLHGRLTSPKSCERRGKIHYSGAAPGSVISAAVRRRLRSGEISGNVRSGATGAGATTPGREVPPRTLRVDPVAHEAGVAVSLAR